MPTLASGEEDLLAHETVVAAHHVLHCGGGEAILHGDVEVAGEDGLQEALPLQVGDEVARDGVFPLPLVVALRVRHGRVAELLAAAAPVLRVAAPDLVGVERHVHAEDDRQALLRLGAEFLRLVRLHGAEHVVHADEVDAVDHLRVEAGIDRIRRLEEKDLDDGGERVLLAFNHIKNRREYFISPEAKKKLAGNIVLLRAIDSGTEAGRIGLENIKARGIKGLVSIKTSRNQIQLIFPDSVSVEEQEKLIALFNKELNEARETYGSLFMTNFRDNDRKRISFGFAYDFLNYLYFTRVRGETL